MVQNGDKAADPQAQTQEAPRQGAPAADLDNVCGCPDGQIGEAKEIGVGFFQGRLAGRRLGLSAGL